MKFRSEIREQLADPEAYLGQAGNLLFGLTRLLGWWSAATIIYTGGLAIIVFITYDVSPYSQSELQEVFVQMVVFAGSVAAMLCLLFNVGRFRNVFDDRAQQRYAFLSNVQSQVDTIEALLIKHGLITKADAERRRSDTTSDHE